MQQEGHRPPSLLLIDTCPEHAAVALCEGAEVRSEVFLPERSASVCLLRTIGEVLRDAEVCLRDLSGIGVVNGPGSFTGVRVGLAVAKGLCEASSLPLAAVSRLAMLAETAQLRSGYAVLRAGRDELYVRDASSGHEWLSSSEAVCALAEGAEVVCGDDRVPEAIALLPHLRSLPISARHACRSVRRRLAEGCEDPARVDANYVRNEEAIYARKLSAH